MNPVVVASGVITMPRTVLLAVCIAATVTAQDTPTFRVDTRLVEVDVIVHQKNEPVSGLTADDFTLFDRGKKQRIAIFSVRQSSDVPAQSRLPAGVVTNRIGLTETDRAEAPAPTIILLDTLNSEPDHMARVRQQLLLYLDRAPENEVFALYSLNKTLNRLHGFTADRDQLRAIVNRWNASASVDKMAENLVADVIADLDSSALMQKDPQTRDMAKAATKEMGDDAILNRAMTTAFALEMIAKHLSGLPGRKKLIWVTGAFPAITSEIRSRVNSKQIETRDYSRFINKATRALNEAQVAVYPIDSRPLCSPTCAGDPMFLRVGIDTMNLVAGATGGRAVYVTNDVAGAIEDSVRDSEITYRLGFYPDSSALDGKDHNIKVQVARKGVDVRYRRAYLAAESKPPKPADRLALLRSSMQSPLDATQIGLAAELLPASMTGDAREVLLKIDIQPLQLSLAETANGNTVSTAFLTVASFFQNKPKIPANFNDLKITFTEARLAEARHDGYLLRLKVDERGIPGKMRITVQDRFTGMTGSVTLDVR